VNIQENIFIKLLKGFEEIDYEVYNKITLKLHKFLCGLFKKIRFKEEVMKNGFKVKNIDLCLCMKQKEITLLPNFPAC